MYDKFYETLMNDNDFEAKPMVLLIGQYSVGKTSFIRYLLECDYQGMRVGPEPTTDKFISVMYGDDILYLIWKSSREQIFTRNIGQDAPGNSK